MEAHHTQPHRSLTRGGIGGTLHARRRTVDEILQHIVEEAHHVLNKERLVFPLEPIFQVERGQAAHSRPLLAILIDAGRQHDLRTEIGGLHRQTSQFEMLRHRAVHVIGEDQIGLTRLNTGGQDADPQSARVDLAHNRVVLGRGQRPFLVILHGAHEGVRNQNAVMQVLRLAVRIAAGRATDFDEFLHLGVADRQIDRRRATPQAALRDRQRHAVHHADERNHAGGLAVLADLFTNRAQIAPIGPNAAALGGQRHVLVPQPHNTVEAVGGFIEEAGDRQAALGATVGQNRGGGHEPHLAHVVVDALRMALVVTIIARHAGEQILIPFAGHQIAIVQRRAAEICDQGVTRPIHMDLITPLHLYCVEHGSFPLNHDGSRRPILRNPAAASIEMTQNMAHCDQSTTRCRESHNISVSSVFANIRRNTTRT